MTSFVSSHTCNWSVGVSDHLCGNKGRFNKLPSLRCCGLYFPLGRISFSQTQGQCLASNSSSTSQSRGRCGPIFSSAVDDDGTVDPDKAESGNDEKQSSQGETGGVGFYLLLFLFKSTKLIKFPFFC